MDDLVELTRKHLEEEPDEEMDLLNEMTLDEGFLRLGLITGFLVKTKQYGSQIDREVSGLKSDVNSYVSNKNPDLEKKKLGEVFKTIGNLHFLQRKMIMYSSLVSGSTGMGVDKSFKILQKMEKEKKRR